MWQDTECFPPIKTAAAFVLYSESPASESEGAQSSPVKNKHSEDDPAEAEGHEVKRLKFDKEGEARDAPNQTASSEVSLGMGEETETSSTSQDKEKDATCARQHCTEEEEEGISGFIIFALCIFQGVGIFFAGGQCCWDCWMSLVVHKGELLVDTSILRNLAILLFFLLSYISI